jgi:predicted dehydrogenase
MVGGGPGAFIGEVHRKAAALDGQIELVAGAFSSSPEKSRQKGEELFLDPERVYGSYEEMAVKESERPADERIDFVSIVTPNFLHHPVAKTFLQHGFHVVCDKPMTTTIEEAEELCELVDEHDAVFALTHNYSGYPMVKEAREMVRSGDLGEIRKIVVEYPQGWLATPLEETGDKQASWRTDPEKAGVSSALGDIGSHAEHLARYITGLELDELIADTTAFVEGRELEDDANILIHYDNGARGVLHCSQVSVGEENDLNIRIWGTDGALEWHQETPNYLQVRSNGRPERIYKRGNEYLSKITQYYSRLPFGHPEAFIEAFANIYLSAARTIAAYEAGERPEPFDTDFPTVQAGAYGVHFIHKAVESGKKRAWLDASYAPPGT